MLKEVSCHLLGLKFCDCSNTSFLILFLRDFFRFLSITTMRSTSSNNNPTDKLMIIASSAASELAPNTKQSFHQLVQSCTSSHCNVIPNMCKSMGEQGGGGRGGGVDGQTPLHYKIQCTIITTGYCTFQQSD